MPSIAAEPDTLRVRYHRFDRMPIARVVAALADLGLDHRPARSRSFDHPAEPVAGQETPTRPDAPLKVAHDHPDSLLDLDQSRYSFVADVGDCWFIGLELRADIFLAPGYYASMGFGVPGSARGRGWPTGPGGRSRWWATGRSR